MKIEDVLVSKINEIGELLRDRNNRTTGSYAVDINGFATIPSDSRACKWCLSGALAKVEKENIEIPLYEEVSKVLSAGPIMLCVLWDNATVEEQDEIVEKLLNYVKN